MYLYNLHDIGRSKAITTSENKEQVYTIYTSILFKPINRET